jgi:predicted transcriptional regulator
MRAIEAVRKPIVTMSPDAPLTAVAKLMADDAVGAVVIVDGGKATGIVTDRDLVVRGMAKGNVDGRADSVMSTEVVVANADGDLRDVFACFDTHAVRRVVLERDGVAVGVLSVDDLVMDLLADLLTVVKPVTAEVLFGHHDAATPALA